MNSEDLSDVCEAVFDCWHTDKAGLNYQIMLAAGATKTRRYISAVLERGESFIRDSYLA